MQSSLSPGISPSIRSNSASAARAGTDAVGLGMDGETWKARAGDVVRLKSGGVLMTATKVNHEVKHPFAQCVWFDVRQALKCGYIELDALDLVTPEESASTDCPEARMAGGNNNNKNKNNNKNNKLR